ncbi:unnamed protein product [Echinostoma caproni]|uniref:Miff domain-containing protein n=1 Tax=Echinostoma caproni TaxID=27848 RepID=A0A183AS25_9TREM|nr:unnamed protein product [Echinostoma caproni]
MPQTLDDFQIDPIHTRPSLEPPPNTLVLNNISYPDVVGRLRDEYEQTRNDDSTNSSPKNKNKGSEIKDPCEDPVVLTRYLSPTQVNNSAHPAVITHESKRLRLLERRVNQLEQDNLARQQWDKIGLMLTGVYFAYRVLHWIATHL